MTSNCHNKRCESCGRIYDGKASGMAEVRVFTYETDRSIEDALSMNICPVCAERVKNLLIPTSDILVATKYASNKELLERNSAILEHFDPLSGHEIFEEPCGWEPFEEPLKDCEVKTDDTDMG